MSETFPEFKTEEQIRARLKMDYWLSEFLEHCEKDLKEPSEYWKQRRLALEERIKVLNERLADLVMEKETL